MGPDLEGLFTARPPNIGLSWRPFPRSPADKSVIPVKSRVIPGSPFGQVRPWEWPYLVVILARLAQPWDRPRPAVLLLVRGFLDKPSAGSSPDWPSQAIPAGPGLSSPEPCNTGFPEVLP